MHFRQFLINLLVCFGKNPFKPQDIPSKFGMTEHHKQVDINRSWRMGLLVRKKGNDGEYIYMISKKGNDYLKWLKDKALLTSATKNYYKLKKMV